MSGSILCLIAGTCVLVGTQGVPPPLLLLFVVIKWLLGYCYSLSPKVLEPGGVNS